MRPEFKPEAECVAGLPRAIVGGCLDLANAMPDLEYVASPCLIQGQVITLTGHPGHGKSTTGAGMAFAVALGERLGALLPVLPGRVYYVSAEDIEGTRRRIFAEAARRRLSADERVRLNHNLRWVQLNGAMTPGLILAHIEEDAGGELVRAVFVDTGPALFSGDDENANVAMQQFATDCRMLTTLSGAPCVVIYWHPAKSATADNLAPRGGSALLGAVDGNLTVWLDPESGIATLARSAWKWRGEHFDPLHFRFDSVDLLLPSGRASSIRIAVPVDGAPQREAKPARRDVALDALREVIGEYGERMPEPSTIPKGTKAATLDQWRSRWQLRTGYTDSTPDSVRTNFNKDKDALLKAGMVTISAPYVWTA